MHRFTEFGVSYRVRVRVSIKWDTHHPITAGILARSVLGLQSGLRLSQFLHR